MPYGLHALLRDLRRPARSLQGAGVPREDRRARAPQGWSEGARKGSRQGPRGRPMTRPSVCLVGDGATGQSRSRAASAGSRSGALHCAADFDVCWGGSRRGFALPCTGTAPDGAGEPHCSTFWLNNFSPSAWGYGSKCARKGHPGFTQTSFWLKALAPNHSAESCRF